MQATPVSRAQEAKPQTGWQMRWLSRGSMVLVGLLLLYALLTVKRSESKLLWFDELGTLNVASQPTLAGMFRVEPADGNPPLQYLLARPCLHLFGTKAWALRLPSMLGIALAIVCLYLFVARRFGTTAGLVGATLLLFSPLSDYGVEARPYALVVGLTMLLLVFWQRAAMTKHRRVGSLVGLSTTLFALTLAHPFGFLWGGAPLAAAETFRWWRLRRVDRPMLCAGLLGFSGFLITIYFGHLTHRELTPPPGYQLPAIWLPTMAKFGNALRWNGGVPPAALLLPTGAMAVWLHRRQVTLKSREPRPNAPMDEWIAAVALLATMFLIYLFTMIVTHYFWARYIVPGTLGCFLLLAMACGYVGRRWVAITALALGLALTWHDRHAEEMKNAKTPSPQLNDPSLLSLTDPTEPIVIEDAVRYPQRWWYSTPAMRARLHFVADAEHAAPHGDLIGEVTLISMHRAGSQLFPVDTLNGFLSQNRRFLLLQGNIENGDWFHAYLLSEHYEFALVAKDASGETLFDVSAPASAP